MPKLFVLMFEVPYELGDPLGVYSTQEKAQEAKFKAGQPYFITYPSGLRCQHQRDIDDLNIVEMILDAEPA